MKIKSVLSSSVADRWDGARSDSISIPSPSIQDVLSSIDRLDAKQFTMVCLDKGDGVELVIGGGGDKYVVYFSPREGEFWNLISEKHKNNRESVVLNAGGQEGDFEQRQVVQKDKAVAAGKFFAETGEMDTGLLWEKQVN